MTHPQESPGGRRSRILVVDDSPTALYVLQATLESANYEVSTASDGREGLRKVRESIPDLILTDSAMPDVDGFAFIKSLKADAATRSIPVIMLTSADPSDPDLRKEDVQPDAFVIKTYDFARLLDHIHVFLKRT